MNSFKTRGTSMKIIRKPSQFNLIDSAIRQRGADSIEKIVLTSEEIEKLYWEYRTDRTVAQHINYCLRQVGYHPTTGDCIVVRGVRCQYEGE